MGAWFNGLSALEQTLFVVAAFATTVFAIQVAFTLFGIGEADDADPDQGAIADDVGTSDIPFGDVFTIRNGVSFLMGLGWGGLMAYDWGLTHTVLALLVGMFVGAVFVGVNMGLLALMSMLRHEGNLDVENAVGRPATVSLAVPERRSGVGKVSVSVQGRLLECHAVTDGGALARNMSVTVVGLAGSQLVVAGA